jgi:hypothetical protein
MKLAPASVVGLGLGLALGLALDAEAATGTLVSAIDPLHPTSNIIKSARRISLRNA